MTTPLNIYVEAVEWREYKDSLTNIRLQVFINEQGVKPEDEWDNVDALETTQHYLVSYHIKDIPSEKPYYIACARIDNAGKIGRMAVLKEYRNQQVGSQLLRFIINQSLENNRHKNVYLYAQIMAKNFYQKRGFRSHGDNFDDAGIPHIKMTFDHQKASNIAMLNNNNIIRFNRTTALNFHLHTATKNTLKTIDILSENLSEAYYQQQSFIDALSYLARRQKNTRIRILVKNTQLLQNCSHKIVALAQKLPSKISLLELTQPMEKPNLAYIIFDQKTLLFFSDEKKSSGFINYHADAESKHQLNVFDHYWNQYTYQNPNLKQLLL